jgi:hypothetical protein
MNDFPSADENAAKSESPSSTSVGSWTDQSSRGIDDVCRHRSFDPRLNVRPTLAVVVLPVVVVLGLQSGWNVGVLLSSAITGLTVVAIIVRTSRSDCQEPREGTGTVDVDACPTRCRLRRAFAHRLLVSVLWFCTTFLPYLEFRPAPDGDERGPGGEVMTDTVRHSELIALYRTHGALRPPRSVYSSLGGPCALVRVGFVPSNDGMVMIVPSAWWSRNGYGSILLTAEDRTRLSHGRRRD